MSAAVACTRLNLATSDYSLGRGSGVLTLPSEVLATSGFWGRDSYCLQLCTKWRALEVPMPLIKISSSQDETKGHRYGNGTCGEEDGDRGGRESEWDI